MSTEENELIPKYVLCVIKDLSAFRIQELFEPLFKEK